MKKPKATFEIEDSVPIPPKTAVGTRGKDKNKSDILKKAREAFDADDYETLDAAVDAYYKEYSKNNTLNDGSERAAAREKKTKQRMKRALKEMGPHKQT